MPKSTNKDPRKIIIDNIQSKWAGKVERDDEALVEKLDYIHSFNIRPKFAKDGYPSVHCIFDEIDTDQKAQPQKVTQDHVTLELIHYSRKYSNQWNTHQTIKEIIVEDNRVQSTPQKSDSGFEMVRLETTSFYYILEGNEKAVYYFVMKIVVQLQESY